MDTIENQQGVSPNQSGRIKNIIVGLWGKFPILITFLTGVAVFYGILYLIYGIFILSEFLSVYLGDGDRIIISFVLIVVFPTICIMFLIWMYCFLMRLKTQSSDRNNNPHNFKPGPRWIDKIKSISLLIILGLLILMVYFIITILAIWGTVLNDLSNTRVLWPIDNPLVIILGFIILESIPIGLALPFTLSEKLTYSLFLCILGFGIPFLVSLIHLYG